MQTLEQATPNKIGRYVIQQELGRGAMGVVYKAQDPAIGRTVAVKSIRIAEIADPREQQKVRERIFREAQSAGVLSHSHIVTIYDIQEENGVAFIFMEYIEGSTLEKMLLEETAPPKELILTLLRQTAAALDYAHSKGIVHRDVKPANIMVRSDWTAKIADFGIARMQSQSLTQTGLVLGTPNYMSPEQIQGKHVDGRADQFSLGVIAYEVMTGEKPFVAESLPTLLFKLVAEPPMPAVRLNPTLDPSIDAVLQKALSKSPEGRWETCGTFIAALEDACLRHPGWTTQRRGQILSAPTEAAIPGLAAFVSASVPPARAPAMTAPAAAIPPSPPVEQVMAPIPAPRFLDRPEYDEDTERAGSKTPILVGVIVLLLGLGGYGAMKFFAGGSAKPQTETARKEPVPAPSPPLVSNPVEERESSGTSSALESAERTGQTPVRSSAPYAISRMHPLEIRTTPPGARVIVDDGAEICISPCTLELRAGRHTLTAQLEQFESANRVLNLPEEGQVYLSLRQQTGSVAITSTPPGATINIDGADYAQKAPVIVRLPVGKHKITVSMPGLGEKTQEFEVQNGESSSWNVYFSTN